MVGKELRAASQSIIRTEQLQKKRETMAIGTLT